MLPVNEQFWLDMLLLRLDMLLLRLDMLPIGAQVFEIK